MNKSIFSILNTYKPTETLTPEENYTTELFVYLLNYSLQNNTALFAFFMKILGENVEIVNYHDYDISTRKVFYTMKSRKAFPDIIIETENKYYFIEAKIESGLNYYSVNDDCSIDMINQIQKYQDIEINRLKKKNIFILTKYRCDISFDDCPDFRKKIKWYDLYNLLEHYQSRDTVEIYLVNETKKYMEDKGMDIPKVSYEIVKGIESLCNLIAQMEIALEGIKYTKSFSYEGLGYYIFYKKKKMGWVGTLYDGNNLEFEHYNPKVISFIKENLQNYELAGDNRTYHTFLNFDHKHYFCLNAEEQIDLLKKWITDNYEIIIKHSM